MQTVRYSHLFVFAFLILLLAGGVAHGAEPKAADPESVAKIQAAMSAAPLAVSLHATILDWPAQPSGEFVVLREGSNATPVCRPGLAAPRPIPCVWTKSGWTG